jgi:hypothetical protein
MSAKKKKNKKKTLDPILLHSHMTPVHTLIPASLKYTSMLYSHLLLDLKVTSYLQLSD